MCGAQPLRTAVRIVRAAATNQVARLAPSLYVRMTSQTGRGDRAGETPETVADYFERCIDDYLQRLKVAKTDAEQFFQDKVLLEYGPGDLPGVALLMIALGAKKVICADRFPLVRPSAFGAQVMASLLQRLPERRRARAQAALLDPERPQRGFRSERIQYVVQPSGLSHVRSACDLVYSRAVLEHVDDLDATFADMDAALKPRGIAIHLVDLKSHGLHGSNPLDFLTWPSWLWNLMYSQKGMPNRWRINRYRAALARTSLRVDHLEPIARYLPSQIAEVRAHLAPEFRALSDEDLSWMNFWLVAQKR
ncbi:MAG: hypothetical protein OHK0044_10580 [Burkholderiaceae bacterium]